MKAEIKVIKIIYIKKLIIMPKTHKLLQITNYSNHELLKLRQNFMQNGNFMPKYSKDVTSRVARFSRLKS